MPYSIVNKADLNEEFRIDAEYYSPENLLKEGTVTKHDHKRLGDLCDLIAGPFGSTVTTGRYDATSDKRYIRGKDIQSFFLEQGDAVYIENDLFEELPQFHLKADDILLTVVGMKFGKSAIIYSEDCPAIFSNKSTLIRNPSISVWYLLTFLSSSTGYGLVRRGQRGAAQPGINLFDIRNIPVPLFSDKFQAKIEILVRRAKSLVIASDAELSGANTILLSKLGLTDWKPKHHLTFIKQHSITRQSERIDAEYYQPKYDEIINAIKGNAGGWDTLGSLVSVRKCIEVGSSEYIDEGIPFVRVSNLSPYKITEEKYISEKLYLENVDHQPRQGEILFSKDATPGIAHYLSEHPRKMIPSGGILRLKSKTGKVNNEYLALVLNSILTREQANRDVGGSVILHWRPDQVKETLIPLLPEEEQINIQKKVAESSNLRNESNDLLEYAKRAVELAIKDDEHLAKEWLEKQIDFDKGINAN